MKTSKPLLAATETILILPALLFMVSLFMRQVQPHQYEPAHTAQRIVDWYAARPNLGLSLSLIALPLLVLFTGAFTLFRSWKSDDQLRQDVRQAVDSVRSHIATAVVALATVTAGGILAIVALHVITD